jgi:shikimate kinase
MTDTPAPIVLVGFMGAGKTTVGRTLAARLGGAFVDLDDLISERTGRSPRRIIDEDGEAAFREEETAALLAALATKARPLVIATGGGAWTFERNRSMICEKGCSVVWLDAPFELCCARINATGDSRPLARDESVARRLYEERLALYRLATYRIEVSGALSAEQIAARITGATSRVGSRHAGEETT